MISKTGINSFVGLCLQYGRMYSMVERYPNNITGKTDISSSYTSCIALLESTWDFVTTIKTSAITLMSTLLLLCVDNTSKSSMAMLYKRYTLYLYWKNTHFSQFEQFRFTTWRCFIQFTRAQCGKPEVSAISLRGIWPPWWLMLWNRYVSDMQWRRYAAPASEWSVCNLPCW